MSVYESIIIIIHEWTNFDHMINTSFCHVLCIIWYEQILAIDGCIPDAYNNKFLVISYFHLETAKGYCLVGQAGLALKATAILHMYDKLTQW